MSVDPVARQRILDAAAALLVQRGVASVRRRDVAAAADVSRRQVDELAASRTDLLRMLIDILPFPPVAVRMAEQAENPDEPALRALLFPGPA